MENRNKGKITEHLMADYWFLQNESDTEHKRKSKNDKNLCNVGHIL